LGKNYSKLLSLCRENLFFITVLGPPIPLMLCLTTYKGLAMESQVSMCLGGKDYAKFRWSQIILIFQKKTRRRLKNEVWEPLTETLLTGGPRNNSLFALTIKQ
jgi:hypothetical protein